MKYIGWRSLLLSVSLVASPAAAAERPVGFAVAAGSFLVDSATVGENATLFDGSRVETSRVPVVITLDGGTQLRLAAHSKVRISGTRLLIEKGLGQISNPGKYEVHARTLRVVAADPKGVARARVGVLEDEGTVSVSTIDGSFRVINQNGQAVTDVAPGEPLNLVPQLPGATPAAEALTRVVGCVSKEDKNYFVKDEISKAVVQLIPVELVDLDTGQKTLFDLEKQVKKRLDLTGYTAPSSVGKAATTLTLSTLKRLGGCRNLAAIWWPALAGASTVAVTCARGECHHSEPVSR